MADTQTPRGFTSLTGQTREIWDENADWWDRHSGDDGLEFQRTIIVPITERLLALRPGEVVLDLACGNGIYSRKMADAGAHVVAVDFSERLIRAGISARRRRRWSIVEELYGDPMRSDRANAHPLIFLRR